MQHARTWVCEHTIPAPGISFLASSAANTSMAGGEWSGDGRLWGAATGACHTTLAGHTARVQANWIDSDGLKLISASADCTVKVWDAQALACITTLELGEGDGVLIATVMVSEGRLFCCMRSTFARGDKG